MRIAVTLELMFLLYFVDNTFSFSNLGLFSVFLWSDELLFSPGSDGQPRIGLGVYDRGPIGLQDRQTKRINFSWKPRGCGPWISYPCLLKKLQRSTCAPQIKEIAH